MSEATENAPTHKGRTAVTQVAAMGMALMGSSLAGSTMSGEQHVDHGYSPARWAAVGISGFGWVVGAIAFPFGIWALVVLGAVLQVVAIVVNLAMNSAGYGARGNDQWAQAKATAQAARAAGS
jgi:hypothetical protein